MIVAPNILLRGGPKALLTELHETTLPALDAALIALREVHPHPRDYVTEAAFDAAHEEHWKRLETINRIVMDMQAIAGHLIMGGVR